MTRRAANRRLVRAAFALLFALGAAPCLAQDHRSEKTTSLDTLLVDAEELTRAGELARAERLLGDAARRCVAADDADCLIRVYSSLGWLQGQRADAQPPAAGELAEELRRSAVAYYERAHRLRPDHPRLRKNLMLALHQAGDVTTARELLQRSTDPGTSEWLLLGDLLRRAGDYDGARDVYFRVETDRPDDPEVHRRLLQTYRNLPGDAGRHKAWCERLWQRGMHAAAAQGLELLMAERNPYAEWSLLHWAEQRVLAGSLGEADVARLRGLLAADSPADRPLEELAGMLNDPQVPADSWWRRTPLHQHVVAEILRHRGNELAAAGLAGLGARALEQARSVAPTTDDYSTRPLLEGRSTVWVDATTDLAALYLASGDGDSFERLEQDLFHEKSAGYVDGDLETIHRLHTVLGVIYADKGQWRGGSFTNGIFQLRRALETSQQLAEQRGASPPPLPHLRSRYAGGLAEVGNHDLAVETYRQTAMEYLSIGPAASSLEAIGSVKSLGRGDQVRELEAIARTRLAIESRADVVRDLSRTDWLSRPDALDLPDSFVQQQRAATFLELGEAAEKAGDEQLEDELKKKAAAILESVDPSVLRPQLDDETIQRLEVRPREDGD